MYWNHRIVRITEEGETMLRFCEVHYREEDGTPFTYTEPFMMGEDMSEMVELAARLVKAATLPILDESEFYALPPVIVDGPAPQDRKPFDIQDLLCINPTPKGV